MPHAIRDDTGEVPTSASADLDALCTLAAPEADAGAVGDRLGRFGVARIEGFCASDLISAIRETAETVYRDNQALVAAGLRRPQTQKAVRLNEVSVGGRRADEALATPRLRCIAEAALGRAATISETCFVRTLFPDAAAWRLPFHQDQSLMDVPLLNVWIPLTPCGVEAPGLEIAATSRTELLAVSGPPDSRYAAERRQIAEGLVIATFGREALWHPPLVPGDALVFRGTTVHRTYVSPAMTMPRTSVELRFV